MLSLILDCIFPPACLSCKNTLEKSEKNYLVCDKCKNNIVLLGELYCSECGKRIPSPDNAKNCHSGSFPVFACGDYNNTASRNLIHSLKYSSIKQTLLPIAKFLISPSLQNNTNLIIPERETGPYFLDERNESKEHLNSKFGFQNSKFILTFIPLFRLKENTRGYNQSELIASAISKIIKEKTGREIPIQKILKRNRNTKTQTEIKDYATRAENIKNCFSLIQNLDFKIQNSHIVLVDDVFTSGSTMKEAIKTLRQNGFKNIIGFVVLKT